MNRFALLALYRSLTRHRLHTALNIGGLAVGLAVFMVLGLYVRFETTFERWLPHHDQIYIVQTAFHMPGSPFDGAWPAAMGNLLDELREDFPGTVGTRINNDAHGFSVVRDGALIQEDAVQVDPSFFQVFDLPMARGDRPRTLSNPRDILISETTARKYFGGADPIGQTLTIAFDEPSPYRVTGVFKDLPKNTDLKISILSVLPRDHSREPYWSHWGSVDLPTYLRFETPAQARAFEQKLPAFVDRRGAADLGKNVSKLISLPLAPITGMHLRPSGQQTASLKQTVATLGIVGLLSLLIAVINYVNLATAGAGLRAREVAMRKVLGASRRALFQQFVGEAVITVALAVLVGLALTEICLPFVNAAGGLSLSVPYGLAIPVAVVLALIVGGAAGVYPALLISNFPTASVLAAARAPGGGRAGGRTRDILVLLQFGLAIAFIIGTFVLVTQTRHVRSADLGFQREGLMIVPLDDASISQVQVQSVIAQLRALPGVTGIGLSNQVAGGGGADNGDTIALPGVPGDGPSLRYIVVGQGFFDVYGSKPVAGRLFDDAHGGDDSAGLQKETPPNIVINERAVRTLGFRTPQDAIGKTVGGDRPRTIIGVAPDMRFFSPRLPIDPTFYLYVRQSRHPVASVRFTGDPRPTLAGAKAIWARTVPQAPFNSEMADKRLEKLYEADDQATRLFASGAVLSVLIGCVGLWGLASFNTSRRVKEIGIRKTLGASSSDIVKLLVGQFLRPVLIANLIAWPLAYFALRKWLAGFDDRIALSPLYFIAGSLLALAIAVVTVIMQSLRAARAAPAWALRRE